MNRVQVPFLSPKYDKAFAKDLSVQNLVNIYLEEVPSFVAGPVPLIGIGTPGTQLWSTAPNDGIIRATFQHKGIGYVVAEDKVYSVTTAKVWTELGTLTTTSGHVAIAAVNDGLVFADGAANPRYYKPSTTTFSEITDADVPENVTSVVATNEYFLYLVPSSGRVYASELSDGTSVIATSFFTTESFYDNNVSAIVNRNLVYLFGSVTTEVWYNSGGATIPFDRVSGGVIALGIAAAYSPAVVLDKVIWLAQNEAGLVGLVMVDGVSASVITNRDFVEKVASYVNISDAFSWVDSHNGHHFYNLTFPSAEPLRGRTLTYDLTTGIWLERQSLNLTTGAGPGQDRHIASSIMFLDNKQLIGSAYDGNIYELSSEFATDDGLTISREVTSPHITTNGQLFSLYNLEIDLEGGIGLDGSVQGSNPLIGLRYSKDRGHTWSETKWREAGKLGEYLKRPRWSSLGGGYSLTIQFIMTDPIKWTLIGLSAEIEATNV